METKNKGKFWLPFVMAACVALGLLIGTVVSRFELVNNGRNFNNLNKLSALLQLIDAKYVDSVNISAMTEKLIPQVLGELDPHSVYISADERKITDEQINGSFCGIGVQFTIVDDTICVISVVKGGPSERAGIQTGDRIVTINGKRFTGKNMDTDKILEILRGNKGSTVKLGIKRYKRPGLMAYNIIRDEIPVNSIDAKYKIGRDIGYIKIGTFGRTAHAEFLQSVAYLKRQGCKRFVIDLRGNTGGLMDAAVNIANEFLPDNRLILYTQGRAYPRENVYSNGKGSCQNDPVVIMMDEWSASSSEILAGALQDNDRAIVVGRRSFGKGLVQTEVPFKDGSAVRLTIARFYIPSGRCIQKPYKNGTDQNYQMDILNRFNNGEFNSRDSIRLPKNLKFKTVGGRTVYGGGGIMPDYFVSYDTYGMSVWFTQVANGGIVSGYTVDFVNANRKLLRSLGDPGRISAWMDSKNIMPDFVRYAESRGFRGRPEFIAASAPLVMTQIKAGAARMVLGEDAYWKLLQVGDNTLTKAVEVVERAHGSIVPFRLN